MSDENHEEGDFELPLGNSFHLSLETVHGHAVRSSNERSHTQHSIERQRSVATTIETLDLYRSGIEPPGNLLKQFLPITPETIPVTFQTLGNTQPDEFHDSESDIFALYNACNGEVHHGLLDIRKLDELSAEELKFLNVARLREIWLHTAAGCPTCDGIVRTLNLVRGILGQQENPLDEISH